MDEILFGYPDVGSLELGLKVTGHEKFLFTIIKLMVPKSG